MRVEPTRLDGVVPRSGMEHDDAAADSWIDHRTGETLTTVVEDPNDVTRADVSGCRVVGVHVYRLASPDLGLSAVVCLVVLAV